MFPVFLKTACAWHKFIFFTKVTICSKTRILTSRICSQNVIVLLLFFLKDLKAFRTKQTRVFRCLRSIARNADVKHSVWGVAVKGAGALVKGKC